MFVLDVKLWTERRCFLDINFGLLIINRIF